MRCALKIVTRSGGTERSAEFRGALTEREGHARVLYVQDGDPSVLDLGKDWLVMERRGGVRLRAEFSLRGSEMSLSGGSVSEIPLKTLVYTLEKTPSGYCAILEYDLFLFSGPERFHLELFIDREVL